MKKKGQVKFGESIGIIIIVFFVIMSSLIWYDKINSNSLNEISQDDQFNRAFEKYYYLKELDLIHVSQRGIVDKKLDLNALLVFSNYSKTPIGKEYLLTRLGYSTIQIFIYNSSGLGENSPYLNITLYNNTPKKNRRKIREPIIFITYFPVTNNDKKTEFGKLKVKSYILE